MNRSQFWLFSKPGNVQHEVTTIEQALYDEFGTAADLGIQHVAHLDRVDVTVVLLNERGAGLAERFREAESWRDETAKKR